MDRTCYEQLSVWATIYGGNHEGMYYWGPSRSALPWLVVFGLYEYHVKNTVISLPSFIIIFH